MKHIIAAAILALAAATPAQAGGLAQFAPLSGIGDGLDAVQGRQLDPTLWQQQRYQQQMLEEMRRQNEILQQQNNLRLYQDIWR